MPHALTVFCNLRSINIRSLTCFKKKKSCACCYQILQHLTISHITPQSTTSCVTGSLLAAGMGLESRLLFTFMHFVLICIDEKIQRKGKLLIGKIFWGQIWSGRWEMQVHIIILIILFFEILMAVRAFSFFFSFFYLNNKMKR